MNYASKFDGKVSLDGLGAHANGHAHVDTDFPHTTHAPADAIVVPDAHLLFNGDFKQSGVDLILSKDDQELVLHDYFKGEKRAALSSPDGAHLTGDIVKALAGHVEYAQADGSISVNKVIGHVTKLAGTATAIRNGVSIILNQGDNVEKGDVVQSGSGSTLGITFIDGTVFGLSSNARMVLNEMVYDPNGSNNSSLLSLVAGTITFVAGETAKHGDMKIDTPVATMGIRGTAVLVEIDFDTAGQNGLPDTKFQVLVEPDGTTGSYILFDKVTLTPFAIVDKAGTQFNFSNGNFTQSTTGLSPEIQKLITDVFSIRYTDNTKSFDHHSDTPIPDTLPPFKVGQITVTPVVLLVNTPVTTQPSNSVVLPNANLRINQAPTAVILNSSGQAATGFQITELSGVTHSSALDTASGTVSFVDINVGDTPTVSAKFDSFTYQNAAHTDVTATLSALQLADIAAVEAKLAIVPDPGNSYFGSATWTYSVADGAFDFLAKGETLTLTYDAFVDNNYLPSDLVTELKFTITITGTNDVPVITTGPQTIGFVGGKGTQGGDLAPSSATPGINLIHPPGTLTYQESGTLTFTDPDLTDTHSIVVPGQTGDLTGASLAGVPLDMATFESKFPGPFQIFENALSASIATDSTGTGTGTIDWTFAELPAYVADFIPSGETLTLTYTVEVMDSQGATSTQTVTVTIAGNDTPALVWIDTKPPPPSGALWSDGSNWGTGNAPTISDDAIIITDQLQPNVPTYPVTINAAASARSLTMNDFTGTAPELDNQSTLKIAGGLNLNADAILKNFGTISIGSLATLLSISGLAEILGKSDLQNSGTLDLAQGGDFIDQSSITNSGTIEISGGTLDVEVAVANSGGTIQVDSGATLKLNGAAINGGTVTDNGTIDLAGTATLKNGSLGNPGQINVSGTGNVLDNETVTANQTLQVQVGATLTIDDGSKVTNTGNIGTVDGGAGISELTVNDATIDGGTVTNSGSMKLTGTGVLKNGLLYDFNNILVSGLGNALDNESVVGGGSLIILSGGALTIDQGSTFASYALEVDGGTLTLNGGTINAGDFYNDPGGTIEFIGSAISKNGWLYNFGQIDVSGIGNALHNENVTNGAPFEILAGGALLIDKGAVVANAGGTIAIDATATLTLNGAAINGGTVTDNGMIDVAGNSSINGTTAGTSAIITNALLNNGGVIIESGVTLTLDNVTVTGTTFTDTASGAIIQIDNGTTLTLSGVTIAGGTVNDGTIVGGPAASTGLIDVTGDSKIDGGAVLNNGAVTVESGKTLTLDNVTVTDTSIEVDGAGTPVGQLIVQDGTTISGSHLTIDGSGQMVLNNATITGGTITDNGTIDSTGSSSIGIGTTVTNHGTIESTAGTLTIHDAVNNAGMLNANGGTLVVTGDVSGAGSSTISGGGTLDLGGADAQTVTFNGPGTLQLETSSNFTGTISGLATGDIIDLANTAVTSAFFEGSTLIVNGQPTSFQISSVPPGETFAFKSDGSGGTDLEMLPQVLAVGSPPAVVGVEATPIALQFSETVTGATPTKFVISGIPDGAVLSDGAGGHSYTSDSANGSVDVAAWGPSSLANLTITPANDTNFTLSAIVTAVDSNGFSYTLPETEVATVNPTAPTVSPVAEVAGVGRAMALDLGTTVNGFAGDHNVLESLVVSAIPLGVTLSDGTLANTFTSGSADDSIDIASWNLSHLTIKSANAANFTLDIAATVQDAELNPSATMHSTEAVTVNGLPVITPAAAQTIGVGEQTTISGISLSETGNTTGETFTVTVSDTHGQLSATAVGGHGDTVTAAGTLVTITGSLSDVNADLATLKDTDATPGSDPITLTATDSFGNSATSKTVAVTVSGLQVIAPAAQTIGLNENTKISGISLAEANTAAGETFTVTVIDTHGQLSATAVGDGDAVTASGTLVTITGSMSDVNADLATLKDTDATPGSDPITLTAADSLGNVAASQTIAVTVNDVPVITPAAAQTIGVNQATTISGISLSEAGNTSGETFTVTVSDTHGHLSTTAVGDGDTVTIASGTLVTITGSLSDVNADLARLTDSNGTTGSDPITLTASDSFGHNAVSQTVAVAVSNVPVITPAVAQTIGVNQTTAISGISLSETGSTSGETFTVTLSDTHGQLSAKAVGDGDTVTASGTLLTITGSLSDVDTDLATLKDIDATPGSDPITLTATDSFGNSAISHTTGVTVNGLPVITPAAAQTIGVNQTTAISGISLSETGKTSGEIFTVTVSDTHGQLSAKSVGDGDTVTASGTLVTITGSLGDVNADLATLKDTDTTPGSDPITLTATDSFGNAAISHTTGVTVNGLPVIAPAAAQTIDVNETTAISGISLSETGNTTGETFTVTVSDTHGQLSATAVGDGDTVTIASGTFVTITGSLGDVNADLATLKDTDGTPGSDPITLTAIDSFGHSAISQTVAVTVNDVPVITPAADQTIGVNQTTAISGISLSENGNTSGETFTVTLSDTHGQLSAKAVGDGDTVTASGTLLTITGSLTDVNKDLATLTDSNSTPGSDSITLTASDGFGHSAISQTVTVTVNDVPVITPAADQTIGINQTTAISVISLSENGNTTGETFTVTVSDTHGQLSATAVGDGDTVTASGTLVTITGSLSDVNKDLATLTDANGTPGSDMITLTATDGFGNSAISQTVAVTVNDVPVITPAADQTIDVNETTAISGISLSETGNTTGETFTVTVSDTNGQLSATAVGDGDTVTIASGTLVTITGSLSDVNADLATLTDTNGTLGSDPLAVTASDSFGHNAISQTVAVTVINELPTINQGPQTASVADGGSTYASGQFTASDPNNDALTWTINGGSRFASVPYSFGIHEFAVSKVVDGTSTQVFDDTFNGTVPPAGPAILFGSSPYGISYGDLGTYVQGSGTALMEGSNAGYLSDSLGPGNYGDPVFGQFTTLLTGTSFNTTSPSDGLRSGQSFTTSGLFDLTAPAVNTIYGIQLSDRATLEGAVNQPGTETVELGIQQNGNGTASVVLSELNFETGIYSLLQVATINAPVGDNEILLSLSNNAANNGEVVASYTLEKNVAGTEVADGAPVTLAAVGHIFDNEDWTRPAFFGYSIATTPSTSPEADSVMQGTYGQLDLAQDGTWHYVLNPGLASVKALAAGQTAQDNFQVTATNAEGAQSSQTISVTVTGVNDPPVATSPAHYSATPGTALSLVKTGLSVSDVDGGTTTETATLSVGEGIITVVAGNTGVAVGGSGTGSVTLSGTIAQIDELLNNLSGNSTATVFYNDNAASPGSSTQLTLTITDSGGLSDSASTTVDLSGNSGSKDWHHNIDIFGATSGGTSTQWIVPNYDGLTSTVFNGGGLTYDPASNLPTTGGFGSISLVDNLGHTLETITGIALAPGDFGDFIARIESIQDKIAWSGLVSTQSNGPISFTATDIHFANTDGTFTDVIGTGFAQAGSQLSGTVTSVEQLDAQGNVLHTVDFGLSTSLSDVAAALLPDQASQQFYDLVAQGNTNLTGIATQSGTPTNFDFTLDDAPGNHTFTGAPQSTYTVNFGDASSGVTANLSTGTASWGGYNDILVNIPNIIGSKFADTITGTTTSSWLDGGGAPSGSHDTLTAGAGSQHDTFVFAQGYGALTITNFDQASSPGVFDPGEGDTINLNNLSGVPTIADDGNVTVDFGNNDIVTLLHVTAAELNALHGTEFIGNGGNNNSVLIQAPAGTPDGNGRYVPVISSNDFTFSDSNQSDVHTVSSSFDNGLSNLGALDAPMGEFSATLSQDTTGGNSGVVQWTFTLKSTDLLLLDNAGLLPDLNEVYDVTVDNGHGGTATQQISIEIDGSTLPGTIDTVTGAGGPISAGTLSFAPTSSEVFQLQGVSISGSGGHGLSVASSDGISSDQIVVETDQASSIAVSGGGFDGISLTSATASAVVFNAASSIAATGTGSIGIYAFGNGNTTVNDLVNTSVSGDEYGIAAYSKNGAGNVAVNVYANATIDSTASYGILAFNTETGNIAVTTSSGDVITSGSAGIDAINEDPTIALSANSVIDVNTSGAINSGSNATGTGHPPAGILAGYLGSSADPTSYPVAGLYGTVIVNNAADIYAAAGDGIRAFNYGDGNITVNDAAAMIQAFGGSIPTNGYGDGISADNFGTGSTYVTTAAGTQIHSGSSGIFATDDSPSSPASSVVSVVAHGSIDSGNIPVGNGAAAAGILAGYNFNGSDDSSDLGNVSIDDFANITAAATIIADPTPDGIRGYNYGTGTVTITVESGAIVDGPRFGVDAFGQGGNVSITNHGSITGGSDAISETSTGSGTVSLDNFGDLTGNIALVSGATVTPIILNELGANWSLDGNNPVEGSALTNAGTIDSSGTSFLAGLSSIINDGTIEVQSGSLKIGSANGISGTGSLKIDAGATLDIASGVSSGQTVTFEDTTGTLKLDAAQNFHGTISGFSTAGGTQATSDLLDLTNINFNSSSFHETFTADTLTVTDGTNTATIQFTGSVGSLNFVADGTEIGGVAGTSGTLIYDPPATGGTPGMAVVPVAVANPTQTATSTITASAPNQTLTGNAVSDTFAFNFAGVGQATVTDFHSTTDVLQFNSLLFANVQAALNATQDDGHGNTVVTLDAHDTITLSGIVKAQLHASDFHFV